MPAFVDLGGSLNKSTGETMLIQQPTISVNSETVKVYCKIFSARPSPASLKIHTHTNHIHAQINGSLGRHDVGTGETHQAPSRKKKNRFLHIIL